MISRLYGRYVDLLAGEHGGVAFLKWFVLGVLLQIAFMLPAVPLVAASVLIEGDAGKTLAVSLFLAVFAAARVFLFAVPCARVAVRKGLGSRWAWGAGGLVFGQWILGLVAALRSKTPAAAA